MTVGSTVRPYENNRVCTADRRYFAVMDLYIPTSARINRTRLLQLFHCGNQIRMT